MKHLLLLVLALLYLPLTGQLVNIPDANFKAALINAGVDTNGDGQVQLAEAEAVEILAVGVSNISSMAGIEAFSNLKNLACGNNILSELDLSQNTKLEKLWCHNNQLVSLNFLGCSSLKTFECYNNDLQSLDLSTNPQLEYFNLSGNRSLKRLVLKDKPNLTSFQYPSSLDMLLVENCPITEQIEFRFIDTLHMTNVLIENITINYGRTKELELKQLPNLKHLECTDNDDLEKLDLTQCPNLIYVDCNDNSLLELDLSNASKLEYLNCSRNKISELDLSNCNNLKELDCDRNFLLELNLDSNNTLEKLSCNYNATLFSLSVIDKPVLEILECSFNEFLGELTISNCPVLKTLNCRYNTAMDSLALSDLILLEEIDCERNTFLKELSINNLPALNFFDCTSSRKLSILSITACSRLKELYCGFCDLKELHLSGLDSLTLLECKYNNLNHLNVSEFPQLTHLDCSDNNLISLDLSDNQNLTYLECRRNVLSELEIDHLIQLEHLRCTNNLISELRLIDFQELEFLDCSYNLLSELPIQLYNLPNLTSLNCGGNNLEQLDVTSLPRLSYLNFSDCPSLKSFNLKNDSLDILSCSNTGLTALDLSTSPLLTSLYCYEGQLESLNIASNILLENLYCYENNLQSLDFYIHPELEHINCSYNQLTELNLSNCPKLDDIDCRLNQISFLNIRNGSTVTSSLNIYNAPMQYVCCDGSDYQQVADRLVNMPGATYGQLCSTIPGAGIEEVKGHNYLSTNGQDCSDQMNLNSPIKYSLIGNDFSGKIISRGKDEYSLIVPSTAFTLRPEFESNYFSTIPDSVNIDFPDTPSPFYADWCFIPIGDIDDLNIVIIPTSEARPGFESDYKIVYTNKGTTTLSGEITFQFDNEVTTYTSAQPEPGVQNENLLVWNYEDLQPFESSSICVTFTHNTPMDIPPLNGGEDLKFLAHIYPVDNDATFRNNEFLLCQTVVNSYDPNDKTCLEGETVLEEMIGEYIHYLIRFENTGTASAINVVIKDQIDTKKFDLNSLQIVDSSHDMSVEIDETNTVEFIFENIYLPFQDALNDGYVLFKIKTLPTLSLGDSFENTAEIYFDFNFPIITNTANTEIVLPVSTKDLEAQNVFVSLHPNPAGDHINVDCNIPINKIDIYDVQGRLVKQVSKIGSDNSIKVNTENLSKGIYLLHLETNQGFNVQKVIIE